MLRCQRILKSCKPKLTYVKLEGHSRLTEHSKKWAKQQFLQEQGSVNGQPAPMMNASDAQAMKQGTYQVLKGKYGEQGSASVEAQKALARVWSPDEVRKHAQAFTEKLAGQRRARRFGQYRMAEHERVQCRGRGAWQWERRGCECRSARQHGRRGSGRGDAAVRLRKPSARRQLCNHAAESSTHATAAALAHEPFHRPAAERAVERALEQRRQP